MRTETRSQTPGFGALATRTGGANSDLNAVYFTAGIGGEEYGLLGKN
jgi:hypothetical protein